MENLVVGNPECSFTDIVTAITKSPEVDVFKSKFFEIAQRLGLYPELQYELRKDILSFGTKSYAIGLFELLRNWRTREGHNAKLVTLVDILEREQLFSLANLLRELFTPRNGTVTFASPDKHHAMMPHEFMNGRSALENEMGLNTEASYVYS